MAQSSLRSVLIALSSDLDDRVLELGAFLERFGFSVSTVSNANNVLVVCGKQHIDAVVYDLGLTRDLGVTTWLEKLKLISPMTATVALGPLDDLAALRAAAQSADGEYSLLPLYPLEIKRRLRLLVESRAAVPSEHASATDSRGLDNLVGRSAKMEGIRERIRKVAGLTSTVLITGESGVGKELIARAVHKASPRRDQAFVAINCSALPEQLLESELFGHERGAFTGAAAMTKGKFELAHRGTLFLDEIGDMNPYTQAKILRVLEEKEFMRVGGGRNIRVDVRLVAATNADLNARMADGRFREDLYYRLKVLTVEVPPLRDRADDIPELVRAFLDRFARTNRTSPKRVTDETLSHLTRYSWPGNVRELRNTLENLIVSAPGEVIDVDDLPPSLARGATSIAHHETIWGGKPAAGAAPAVVVDQGARGSMEDMERDLIRRVLQDEGGNRTRAARVLKIGVRTLQRKIKRFRLDDAPGQ